MDAKVVTGWQTDPFGVHEARYFSADGLPTKLVRDRGVESFDEPPSGPDEVAAAMARMSTLPEPPSAYPPRAYGPRDPYRYRHDPSAERARRLGTLGRTLAITGIILGFLGIGGGLYRLMQAPKPASTPGVTATTATTGTTGMTDAAFVSQAASQTLQQRTVNLVMSATSSAADGVPSTTLQGTGAFDLAEKAATLNWTAKSGAVVTVIREIMVNGYVYLGLSVNGVDLMPKDKPWVAEQVPSQQSATTGLTAIDPTAALAALENQGITVRALGTKVIGGVSCTGYAATPPGAQGTITVWIDAQHLVREFTAQMSISVMAGTSSTSAASPSTASTASGSLDLTMDLSYSAAPVHVTAPPASSTITLDQWSSSLAQNPAIAQLGRSSASPAATQQGG